MAIKLQKEFNDYELNKELKATVVEMHLVEEGDDYNFKITVQLTGTDKVVRKVYFVDLTNMQSQFAQFCLNCNIVDENGEIDYRDLLYSEVVVCLVLTEGNEVMIDYIKKYPGEDYEFADYNQI